MGGRQVAATPWRLFWSVIAVAVVLPAIGIFWAASVTRDAVERRAAAGNQAAVSALAAQMSRQYRDRVSIADDLLVLMSNGAQFAHGMNDALRLDNPFCRVSYLDAAGAVVGSMPLPTCGQQPVPAGAVPRQATQTQQQQLAPALVNGIPVASVLVRLNATERAAVGPHVEWLQVQFPVANLFTPVTVGKSGSYAVVDPHSMLVVAAQVPGTVGRHLAAPAARKLVASGRPGVIKTWAPLMHKNVLLAYEPVAGAPLGVFITLPSAEAFADANHIRSVLLLGLLILAVTGVAAAGLVANVVARRDHEVRNKVDELHTLATLDGLTGLANRVEATRALDRLVALVDRHEITGLGVVFVDLDGFKELNDTHGHDRADRMLRAVTAAMQHAVRPSDMLARFGGDEFVVLAPGLTSRTAARALGERIRRAVSATSLYVDGPEESPIAPLTASVGVATAGSGAAVTGDVLLRAADQAMYVAKRAGGDQVECTEVSLGTAV